MATNDPHPTELPSDELNNISGGGIMVPDVIEDQEETKPEGEEDDCRKAGKEQQEY